MIKAFLLALQLLTRFPVKIDTPISNQTMGQSVLYYPLVGSIIGFLLVAVMFIVNQHTSSLLLAGLLLTLWVMITGALHLDGLADSTDAWLGGFANPQRTLDIMKDPRCGPAAVIMLVIVLLLKWSALEYIIRHQQWQAIIIACVFSRTMILPLFLTTQYVRKNGLGSVMANHIPRQAAWIITLSVLLLLPLMMGMQTLIILIIAILIWSFMRHMMINRISGMTGDTAGASVEIMELVILLGVCFR